MRASGLERNLVLHHVGAELGAVGELFSAWDMDAEEPFRLVEGIQAGAAGFTRSLFSEEQRGDVRATAQGLCWSLALLTLYTAPPRHGMNATQSRRWLNPQPNG